jgi:hypothetical protein
VRVTFRATGTIENKSGERKYRKKGVKKKDNEKIK